MELIESKISKRGMAYEIRSTYYRGLNKGFCSKFQELSPEENRKVQWPKPRDYDNKDEYIILNTVNNVSKIDPQDSYTLKISL